MNYIKGWLGYLLVRILNLLVFPSKKVLPRSLLLIRLDAIGDYVLFRNFVEEIAKSDLYSGYKITLLGNEIWKELSEVYDKEHVHSFVWMNIKKFHNNLRYRYEFTKSVTSVGYDTILVASYRRGFFHEDSLVNAIYANHKIGSSRDFDKPIGWQERIGDRAYTKIVNCGKDLAFEFDKNKVFFEKVINCKISIKKPHITAIASQNTNCPITVDKYSVVFIGGGATARKWNIVNYAKVSEHLHIQYGLKIVLCGGTEDFESAQVFKNFFSYPFQDYVGRTTLLELVSLISQSSLVLSNETSVPHISVALGVKHIFVVSNGNHYGRFTPYPKKIYYGYYAVFPNEIKHLLKDPSNLVSFYRHKSKLDINTILPKDVIVCIDNVMCNTKSTSIENQQ